MIAKLPPLTVKTSLEQDSLVAVRAAFSLAYTSVGPTVGPLRVQYAFHWVLSHSITLFRIELSCSNCVESSFGVGEVASSNLVVPTINFQRRV
jgi:hypothetical protein